MANSNSSHRHPGGPALARHETRRCRNEHEFRDTIRPARGDVQRALLAAEREMLESENRDLDRHSRERAQILSLAKDILTHPQMANDVPEAINLARKDVE